MATNAKVQLFDYDIEKENLARRQAVLAAMQQQSAGDLPAVTVGGMGAAPSLGSVLGALGQQFVAAKGLKDLDTSRSELAQRYKDELKSGFDQYFKTSEGGVGEDGQPIAGDRRKAVFDALASGHPVLREFAQQQLSNQGKGALTAKDVLPYIDPRQIPAIAGGDLTGFKPKAPELKEVGGVVYDPTTRNMVQLGGPKPQQMVRDGDLYEQNPSTGQWKKLDNAPKITTTVNANPVIQGESAFMKKLGEQSAENVVSAQKAKTQAQHTMGVATKLETLDKQGIFDGPTANIATTLGAFANTLGLPVDQSKIGRSEQYNATLATEIAKVLTSGAGVGRSMTDEDRKAFEKQFPQLVNSPQGRQQIVGMLRQAAQQDIQYADEVQRNLHQTMPEASKLYNLAPSNVNYPQPTPQAAPTAGKIRRFNPATGRIE